MVRPDFNIRGALKVVAPFLEALDDSVELFVVYGIVELSPRELLRYVGDRMPSIFP